MVLQLQVWAFWLFQEEGISFDPRTVWGNMGVLAKSARVSGTVEFTATISKDGNIENLQLIRGHPLLVNAAKEAVLQWKYKPTMLNGQAVEVITSIIVNFTLSQ
jgi:protein TonB